MDRASSAATFWIARNPASTRFPFVLRVPVPGEGRLFFAVTEKWPRGKDVFCYQLDSWPDGAEMVEEVPVEACWRVGRALHLTLRRPRLRRSLFVWAADRTGKRLIFWRSQTSLHAARPGIRVPEARGLEGPLDLVVDLAERFPWRFSGYEASITRRSLPAGDYAIVRDGVITAAVERKTATDLAHAAIGGELGLALGDLAQVPRAALVVEGRLSDVVKRAASGKARPGWVLNLLASLQIAHPRVQWMFAETSRLAEDWAYRWLAASARAERHAAERETEPQAMGAPPMQAELPLTPALMDAAARRSFLAQRAQRGTVWTTRGAAEECSVTQATARADLKQLVAEGVLRIERSGRERTFRSSGDLVTLPASSRYASRGE